MKKLLLVMVVSALLVTLGFTQTPDPGSATSPATVKGCLGGSDGNYTVAEDGTRKIFKITTTPIDLKPHVGHEVSLTGQKASATASSAADNSFSVTGLNMISEHCAAAAAAVTATVIPPAETVIAPDPTPASPATPPVADATPVAQAAAPATPDVALAAPVSPPAETVTAPPVEAATPAATVSTPAVDSTAPASPAAPAVAAVNKPAADPVQPTRSPVHARKQSAQQATAATPSDTTVSPTPDTVTPVARDPVTPVAAAIPSSDPVSTPATAAPAAPVRHTGSLVLLVSFVVLVILLGTMAPLIGRWRKRKMLERNGTPNLSFTREESSGQDKPEPRRVALELRPRE